MIDTLKRTLLLRNLLLVAVLVLIVLWLANTPSGLYGKADAVAYAVCHRMESHTYHMGERPMPLCARDTGMHLGILVSILYHLKRGKAGGMPARKIQIVFGVFLLAFAIDGVNSTLPMLRIFNLAQWYEPQNWLRLATGAGLGIAMGSMLMPVVNQSLWAEPDMQPALSSWRQLGLLVAITGLAAAAVTTEIPALVYPLGLLTAGDVLLILTLIFTLVWVMLTKKDNLFHHWKEISWWLVAGFGTALGLIAFMDWLRFMMTGTWQGFVL
jgi:uncharacterized membrane protein